MTRSGGADGVMFLSAVMAGWMHAWRRFVRAPARVTSDRRRLAMRCVSPTVPSRAVPNRSESADIPSRNRPWSSFAPGILRAIQISQSSTMPDGLRSALRSGANGTNFLLRHSTAIGATASAPAIAPGVPLPVSHLRRESIPLSSLLQSLLGVG
jgi:hypothetical protein